MTRRTPTGRRAVLTGASCAALLLAAPEAGATKAVEQDGELIALLDEARRLCREWQRPMSTPPTLGEFLAPAPWEALMARAAAIPARTPEGVRRKAEAAADWLAGGDRAQGLIFLNRDGEALLAWSLLRDLLGEHALKEAHPRGALAEVDLLGRAEA
jgi:hypothetical protein